MPDDDLDDDYAGGKEPWEKGDAHEEKHDKETHGKLSKPEKPAKQEKAKPRKAPSLSRKNIYIVFVCIVAVIAVIAAANYIMSLPPGERTIITKSSCELSGGTWNDCGSPCLGEPQGTICIQVCQPQCEWYSTRALSVKSSPAYNIEPGFRCIMQNNGIEMCWMPEKGAV